MRRARWHSSSAWRTSSGVAPASATCCDSCSRSCGQFGGARSRRPAARRARVPSRLCTSVLQSRAGGAPAARQRPAWRAAAAPPRRPGRRAPPARVSTPGSSVSASQAASSWRTRCCRRRGVAAAAVQHALQAVLLARRGPQAAAAFQALRQPLQQVGPVMRLAQRPGRRLVEQRVGVVPVPGHQRAAPARRAAGVVAGAAARRCSSGRAASGRPSSACPPSAA